MGEDYRADYNIVPLLQSEMARFLWQCREQAKECGDDEMEYVVYYALETVDDIQKAIGPSPI